MGHKAGTTDGGQGRDDGWGTRPGRRMGHEAGTKDRAQGRYDGLRAKTSIPRKMMMSTYT
ncbi:MAG: hypothetical protein CL589_10340 [Alteromonadaceae bacterium]|nr:hypothetical protein [Alteromonadaceae bacterium]